MTARHHAAAMFLGMLFTGWPGWCPAAGDLEPFSLVPTGLRAEVTTNALRHDLFDEYQVRAWSSTEGLAQNHVDKVARDRQGYLWATTWLGLCRFNGREFVHFNPNNTPALRSETISDLLRDRDGEVWATTKRGLYRIRGTQFDYFGEEHGLPSGDIISIAEGPDGYKWLSTVDGLARFDGTNVVSYTPGPQHRRFRKLQFLADGKAVVFVVGNPNVVSLLFDPASGKFEPLPPGFAPAGWGEREWELVGPDADGVLWFRTDSAIHHRLPDGRWEKFRDLRESVKSDRVLFLCDTRGDVWFAGEEAGVLQRYSRGRIARMDLTASHQISTIINIVEEPGGLYWLCTRQGLIQLKERSVQNFGRRHGLVHDHIFTLADLGRGRALLGTGRWPAILDPDNGTIQLFQLKGVNTTSRSLVPNHDGSYWVTDGEHGPTHVATDGRISRTTLAANWPYRSEQYVFFRDSKERLWIGARTNLYVVQGDRVRCIAQGDVPGLPADNVRVIREMPDRTIWLGGNDSGITILSPDNLSVMARYTVTNGLSHDDVWTLELDARGEVWAGTAYGLNRIHSGRCQKLLPEDGLAEGVINQILRDRYGYLWLTGMKGTYRVDPHEVSDFLDGRGEGFAVLPVTKDDGMLNAETNGEQQPAGFVDDRGRLWIPTIAGVSVIDPTKFRFDAKPVQPIIERILLDGRVHYDNGPGREGKISLAEPFRFEAGQGRLLEIRFAAPATETTGTATFEVRLNGYDHDWRQVDRQSSVIYPTLPPGEFSFDLRVSNHHRQTSLQSTEFRFQIAPYFHQTVWFWSLLVLAAAAAGYVLHRRRLAIVSHIRELDQREALLADRERIARDMHDDLGSRLTHISILADVAGRTGAKAEGTKLQELNLAAREAARAVEEIVWSANPGNDTFASLVNYLTQHAENLFAAAGIACRVHTHLDWPDIYLSPQTRHAVFMAFKEAVHNVVKHAGATEVHLTFKPEPTGACLRLEDNGRGFEPAGDRQSEQDGLVNMAARLTAVGGRFAIRSTPGRGTTVEFWLPLKTSDKEDRPVAR